MHRPRRPPRPAQHFHLAFTASMTPRPTPLKIPSPSDNSSTENANSGCLTGTTIWSVCVGALGGVDLLGEPNEERPLYQLLPCVGPSPAALRPEHNVLSPLSNLGSPHEGSMGAGSARAHGRLRGEVCKQNLGGGGLAHCNLSLKQTLQKGGEVAAAGLLARATVHSYIPLHSPYVFQGSDGSRH